MNEHRKSPGDAIEIFDLFVRRTEVEEEVGPMGGPRRSRREAI